MAALDLEQLYKKYEGFYYPIARVYIGGSNPEEDKKLKIQVIDYVVEITSDLKAGIASFSLTNVYNSGSGSFKVKDL